jgi:hypothetical protein
MINNHHLYIQILYKIINKVIYYALMSSKDDVIVLAA